MLLSHETGMEEWPAYHQYSHFLDTPTTSGPIYGLASSVKLAGSTRRSADASLVIKVEIVLVFKGKFVFLSHENGMEEWSAFHQYSHLNGPIYDGLLVQPSPLQTLVGVLSLPWWATLRLPWWFSKALPFFVMRMVYGRMVSIPPIFLFPGETQWSHLCNTSLAELAATTTSRSVVITSMFVIEFKILLVFKGKFVSHPS